MRRFKADLHIHSCLSPCAEGEMTPRAIVEQCAIKGIDIVAICDHNSVENAQAAIQVGKMCNVYVLPGMEVCSREEIHILAIFENMEQALTMQNYVYAHLPGTNKPEYFGNQFIVNEDDEIMGENSRLLIGATTLKPHEIVDKTHTLGGLSIASHVDRPSYGIISQIGFIPSDLNLDAVEVSWRMSPKAAVTQIPGIRNLPCVTSSDAHFPADIGKIWTIFIMESPCFEELRMALLQRSERGIAADEETTK